MSTEQEPRIDPPRLVEDPASSALLRALAKDAAGWAPPPMSTEVRARVRARVVDEARAPSRNRPETWVFGAMALAVAAAALLWWQWPSGSPSHPVDPSPALVAEPGDAGPDIGPDARPLEPAEPREEVPYLEISGNGCGLDLRLELSELDDDVQSVALVLRERDENPAGDDLPRDAPDCEGTIVQELDAALFGPAPAGGTLAFPLELYPPTVRCGANYDVTVCVRDARGRLSTGPRTAPPMSTDEVWGTRTAGRVLTPSGPADPRDLAVGHVVTGLHYEGGTPPWTTPGFAPRPTLVEASIRRVLDSEDLPRGVTELRLETGHLLRVCSSTGVFVYGEGFREARTLRAGERLLFVDPAPRAASATELRPRPIVIESVSSDEDDRVERAFDLSWPDASFVDGVLVHDAGGDSRHTGPSPFVVSVPEPVRAMPASSFDCTLRTEIVVEELPDDVQSIAVAYVPHPGRAGRRSAISCDHATIGVEVPTSLVSRLPVTRDGSRILAAELRAWDAENGDWHPGEDGPQAQPEPHDVRCSTEYAVLACLRGADGTLRSWPGAEGRWTITGPACFARGTPVATPEGERAIESLRPRDRVTSRDVETGEVHTISVHALVPRGLRPLLAFSLSNGRTLEVTAEHPLFALDEGRFREAAGFAPGDRLLDVDGHAVEVLEITPRGPAPVYDLSVDAPHTFIASGIVAHNY